MLVKEPPAGFLTGLCFLEGAVVRFPCFRQQEGVFLVFADVFQQRYGPIDARFGTAGLEKLIQRCVEVLLEAL